MSSYFLGSYEGNASGDLGEFEVYFHLHMECVQLRVKYVNGYGYARIISENHISTSNKRGIR